MYSPTVVKYSVHGGVEQLEGEDRLLRAVDQDQDVAEAAGLLEPLEVPVEGDDAGAEGDRSAWRTRTAADWTRAWARVTSPATVSC